MAMVLNYDAVSSKAWQLPYNIKTNKQNHQQPYLYYLAEDSLLPIQEDLSIQEMSGECEGPSVL